MSNLSPFASVLIERTVKTGESGTELITEYFGSSLGGGRAFALAIQKAQADREARRVVYLEMQMGETLIQASVPIVHEDRETRVSIEDGELF